MPKPPKIDGSPLFPHQNGQYAKKIKGRLHYFGTDHDAALAKYTRERVYLERGIPVPEETDELTLKQLFDRFLTAKKRAVEAGKLSEHQLGFLVRECQRMADLFGKDRPAHTVGPADFQRLLETLSAAYAPSTLISVIPNCKSPFNYARKAGWLAQEVFFGPDFKPPSKVDLRRHRQRRPPREFTREQIVTLLLAAHGTSLEAMILLALNCGFGNTDCAELPVRLLDLERGWIDYSRSKTGNHRRCPLWAETVEALREVIGDSTRELVFETAHGNAWTKATVGEAFAKLAKQVGVKTPESDGVAFYALRHVFKTVAENSTGDKLAVEAIMGHVDNEIGGVYRQGFWNSRLRRVADSVRNWLEVGEETQN